MSSTLKYPKLCPSAISLQLWHLVKACANETILLVSLHIDKKISCYSSSIISKANSYNMMLFSTPSHP